MDEDALELPPGFRFFPTDLELLTYYLLMKVTDNSFSAVAIGEVDLNKCEPWDLPGYAKIGDNELYFYSLRDRKYPTGSRTNRATSSGYWKATGKDKEIHEKDTQTLVGMKKTLVFYRGRAPSGEKSNWVMHEYRLDGKFAAYNVSKQSKSEWVICRVFHKAGTKKTTNCAIAHQTFQNEGSSSIDHFSDIATTHSVPCFSPSMENRNSEAEMAIDHGLTSPADVLFTRSHIPATFPRDSVLLPDQSVLRMVMQNSVPDYNMGTPSDVSQDTAMSSFSYYWSY